ncbi:MAG: hypothetical protein RMM28_11005, partial [Thermoleophilia bacterium]|nr:hypothetical protein [Thermoleophilia bacterium]
LVERVVAPASVALPVRAGERLGSVEIWKGAALLASSPLVAAEAIPEPSLLAKASWFVRAVLDNLWELLS